MILTGDSISAGRALELNLINEVAPRSECLSRAIQLAQRICANAPLAAQAGKRVALGITAQSVAAEATDWLNSLEENKQLKATADALEGPRAFAEKREPHWRAC